MDPRIGQELFILEESQEVPSNSLVVKKGLTGSIKARLYEALLNMQNDPDGRDVLKVQAHRLDQLQPIRMLDDDGEVHYEGLMHPDIETILDDGEAVFLPLDDFGMPNTGCTRLQLFEKGKWEAV